MTLLKEYNVPVTNPKESKICDMPKKELKIVGLRKLSKLQITQEMI